MYNYRFCWGSIRYVEKVVEFMKVVSRHRSADDFSRSVMKIRGRFNHVLMSYFEKEIAKFCLH